MKVHELGEFDLIRMLNEIVNNGGAGSCAIPDLLIGIGDDATAWRTDATVQLGTTDILIQDVHFSVKTTSWHDLGWKALAANISDIAAMGGTPTYALVSLGLPPDIEADHIAELYLGIAEIAKEFNMAIAGGDISKSPMIVISPSVIGQVGRGQLLTRSGAMPGDCIAVTGYLGSSAAGLKMAHGQLVFKPEIASVLNEAHLRPYPRVSEGQTLAKYGVKAAIDISDGLIADLGHICEMSKVGAMIRLMDVPIHPTVRTAFEDVAFDLALTGGEDYELLFTAPLEMIESVSASIPITVIGEITEDKSGKVLVLDEDGNAIDWSRGGWEHFRNRD
ncbi:MAG: thiamine-phosphate kinase [Chloroflexota bacterium]|nr:thiamine-phosphate kinase [Chloroflexota bacterium]